MQPPRCSFKTVRSLMYTFVTPLTTLHFHHLREIISCTHNVSQLSSQPCTIIATLSLGLHPEPSTKLSPNEFETKDISLLLMKKLSRCVHLQKTTDINTFHCKIQKIFCFRILNFYHSLLSAEPTTVSPHQKLNIFSTFHFLTFLLKRQAANEWLNEQILIKTLCLYTTKPIWMASVIFLLKKIFIICEQSWNWKKSVRVDSFFCYFRTILFT